MTNSIAPLQAGDRIGSDSVGGLLHQTPYTLRYRYGARQLVEFAPSGAFTRGPEGILLPANGRAPMSLQEAAASFIEAEKKAAGAGCGDLMLTKSTIALNSTQYYVSSLGDGQFLSEQMRAAQAWAPDKLRTILLDLAAQLRRAEAAGLQHGTFGPGSVFMSADGNPIITGYGQGAVAQALGQAEPVRDVYALTELAYHLVTGQAPVSLPQRKLSGETDPLVPAEEYAQASIHGALLRAISRGLDISRKYSLEDWAVEVEGRQKMLEDGVQAAPALEKAPGPIQPAAKPPEEESVPIAPVRPPRGQPPMRPKRGTPTQTQQAINPVVLLIFLLLLGALAAFAVYANNAGLLGGSDEDEVIAEADEGEEAPIDGPNPIDERAWVNARTIDTVASYTAYIERFPNGYYLVEAQERLDALDDKAWEDTLALNTLEGYQAYIAAFPLGRHVPEAQQIIDKLEAGLAAIAAADEAAWEEAQQVDTVAAYDGYLAAYPDGQYVEEATARREAVLEKSRDDQAFEAAQRLGTRDAYQSYVDRFPKGKHVPKALTMIDKLTTRAGDILTDCQQCPPMVVIPKGSFEMGASEGDQLAKPSEKPSHKVTFAAPFALARSEVTVGQWKACAGSGACRYEPRQGQVDTAPVVYVSWDDAQAYAEWLSTLTGKPYRLPSEAEWEYAARAGEGSAYAAGREASVCKLGNIAGSETNVPWRSQSCGDGIANGVEPVQSRLPNAVGRYDIIGNAAEWVADCDSLDYRDVPTDGRANERGLCGARIARGGSWISGPRDFRLSARAGRPKGDTDDTTGFRVALSLPK